MGWDKITLRQVQQIDVIRKSLNEEDALDAETKLVAILLNCKQSDVDSMPLAEYLDKRRVLDFLNNPIQGKPSKYIQVNGKRYKCIYDVRQMPFARYIESKTFSVDIIHNMHKIAASIVMPMRKTLFGWKVDKYRADMHEQYANDLLDAPFIHVYNSAVFFYHVLNNLIKNSKGYMVKELEAGGMTSKEASKLVQNLCRSLDGNILLKK